jgi:hypothetical protein
MRTIAAGLLCVGFSTIAFADDPSPQAPQAKPAKDALDGAKLLDPIQVDSLSLTPIVETQPEKTGSDMITLDEAMPKKLVRIREEAGGSVNSLELVNNSDQALFLLAGEVIIGGKQDRIIGRNTIVAAKTSQQVPVYCVEHGRWTEQTKEFTTAKALAHGRLRGNASFSEQGAVWAEVHKTNEAKKTANNTDTYRNVATQQNAGTVGDKAKKIEDALAKLPADQRNRLIGFAIAINGKVATVDMFDSHALFQKLEPKLVRSYLTESVDVPTEKDVKPPAPAAVSSFMADADKAEEAQSYETKAASTRTKKGSHADSARVMKPAAKADDKPVYKTYQTH